MKQTSFKVAVVGATGNVGRVLLSILESRDFPISELVPIASERSRGVMIPFRGKKFPCKVLEGDCFEGVDVAFFDVSDALSREWVPKAAEAGAWVIDSSATFRYDDDLMIVVPEVNGEEFKKWIHSKDRHQRSARSRIVTGPNCSIAQLVVVLEVLERKWGLSRVVVSTYQSTSGAGRAAMEELEDQVRLALGKKEIQPVNYPHPIAFNCIPHIGGFDQSGYSSEERKMMIEARKIMGLPDLKMTATAVRVPTLNCHSESVNVELKSPFDLEEVRSLLSNAPGIAVVDNPSKNEYPLALGQVDRDEVAVGRIRRDRSVENGLNMWVVSDNLRKGAALNAVQIAEVLLEEGAF